MKILLLTLEYPPQKGGVASYYLGLMEELRQQGHEVEVVARGLLSRWIWPRWIKGYFTVRALIRKNKPDLLLAGQVLPLGTVAYFLSRKIPYILFVHGTDLLWTRKYRWRRWLGKKILAHAKLVVANSQFTKDLSEKIFRGKNRAAARFLPRVSPVIVYPCPSTMVDPSSAEVELLRRKLGLSGKKVLLTLGRVVERKGHDLVLRALPEILMHVPETVYIVAGVGPDLERLAALVSQLGLQSAVRFVGQISDNERAAYFAFCDLFVMPSRQIGPDVEGFGIVYLEAALFGKPSIGGRSGGVPEAILDGKTGALVDPNDAAAFARVAVQLLRDDRLREELGKNAKARALHEFTWETQIEKLTSRL